VDAIVTPTSPTAAFKIGEKSDDPLQMYLSDIFTISCNLAGICGISIPCGFTKKPEAAHRFAIVARQTGFGEHTKLAFGSKLPRPNFFSTRPRRLFWWA
jgi:aspartyl-tRNA(Asn)/glutamyl-tRNA(Gln) amidotransferase subunit A